MSTAALADFYWDRLSKTHGTEYCAFYMGRNSVWNRDALTERGAFKTEADFAAYIRGRQSAGGELTADIA